MEYRFSKENFMKNATKTTKKLLRNHVDILNRMKVTFNGKFGEIEEYTVDGEEFCLYPVYKEWCSATEQLKLL
ncbi:hypothetical protein KPL26_03205 [Clostridium algidicarnis]|uniref:hypothetical protein n=1 Tax=Clostridium algidicarnis TaxID=37659 RepID=UPI001C0E3A7B|nr:hypothetical protein [Clostridium algidicarnis]MBU3195670.1 hypothetical protein [Clostridium algidicarnis]